jgi:S1-C subfamily serine protease
MTPFRLPILVGLALSLAPIAARAQQATQPAATAQPSLQALDREVQQLFKTTQQQTVRVTVPIHLPTSLLQQEHPLNKWGARIDPQIMQKLAAAAAHGQSGQVFIEARSGAPATQPAAAATTAPATEPGASVQTPADAGRVPLPPQTAVVNAEFVGLVLNAEGAVLVPLFIDAAYLEGKPLQVTVDDARVTTATVLAADRATALSVIRLAEPAGKPVTFAQSKPAAGSLVLMLSPTRRAARLGVWSGSPEDNAVLVTPAGEIAGIVRNGHALFPPMFVPVTRQLLTGQPVKRAALGVEISEITGDDPMRAALPALGSRPAAQVKQVFENTAAQRAGIRPDDIILSLGNERVEDVATFAAAIANYRGATPLRIIRDGAEMTVTVDLQTD